MDRIDVVASFAGWTRPPGGARDSLELAARRRGAVADDEGGAATVGARGRVLRRACGGAPLTAPNPRMQHRRARSPPQSRSRRASAPHATLEAGHLRFTVFDVGQGDAELLELPDQSTAPRGHRRHSLRLQRIRHRRPSARAGPLGARGQGHRHPAPDARRPRSHRRRAVRRSTISIRRSSGRVFPSLRHTPMRELLAHARSTGAVVEQTNRRRAVHASRRPHPRASSAASPTGSAHASATTIRSCSRCVYGDVALLLTGDIGADIERAILPQLTPARIRILKVAHHGSRTSSSAELLETWRPQIAIISCGRGNSFGHPSARRDRTSHVSWSEDLSHRSGWTDHRRFGWLTDQRSVLSWKASMNHKAATAPRTCRRAASRSARREISLRLVPFRSRRDYYWLERQTRRACIDVANSNVTDRASRSRGAESLRSISGSRSGVLRRSATLRHARVAFRKTGSFRPVRTLERHRLSPRCDVVPERVVCGTGRRSAGPPWVQPPDAPTRGHEGDPRATESFP